MLYALTEYESPQACEASVEAIRGMLGYEIKDVDDKDSKLVIHLRTMRSASREFLTAIQRESLVVTRIQRVRVPHRALGSLKPSLNFAGTSATA